VSVAWVLNLDAEDELAHRGAHTPSLASVARVEKAIGALKGLVREGEVIVWPGGRVDARGLEGRAWCPTRWALEQLSKAGARVPAAPSMEVLRAVNHRAFNARLGQGLPGAEFVTTWSAVEAALARGGAWLAKRAFGYAGRGRKKLEGRLTDEERAWVEASLAEGLQLEPLVVRSLDAALHGEISAEGAVRLGVPTVQVVDAFGAWQASVRASGELTEEEVRALRREAQRAAEALLGAGYFGPFGIDAFRWSGGFQPRSEINARFSMGWSVGMGS